MALVPFCYYNECVASRRMRFSIVFSDCAELRYEKILIKFPFFCRKKEIRKLCRSNEKDIVEKLNWMREDPGGVFFGSIARNCGSDSRD